MGGASGEAFREESFAMPWEDYDPAPGLRSLGRRVAEVLLEAVASPQLASASPWLASEALSPTQGTDRHLDGRAPGHGFGDGDLAASSEGDEAERSRLIGLVELA